MSAATSYDELPYTDVPFTFTHPDRLATVARLHGLEPPPVEACRVLELGCGSGGNLISMAVTLPQARFVGIDLSRRQIDAGLATVRALGLANVDLRAGSILDVGAAEGTFDYVVCHGVYSWVPPEVQDKILDVCAANLTPRGLAYVSYNTYPGWHLRGLVRDMLTYHARRFADPGERLRQARAFLAYLPRAVADQAGTYAALLRAEADLLAGEADTYLYHEHLEEDNRPVYFHEMAARVAAKGLQYVGSAVVDPVAAGLSPETRRAIDGMAHDRIQHEQHLDFVCNRKFRRSVFCRAGVAVLPEPTPDALSGLALIARARPVSERPDVASDAAEPFRSASEAITITTNNPPLKAALVALYDAWPRALTFDVLWGEVRKLLGGAAPDAGALRAALLRCHLADLVEFHARAPVFADTASERPTASALARLQAAEARPVTNLRHASYSADDLERLLLRHLDGSRDRAALLDVLSEAAVRGAVAVPSGGLAEALDGALRRLAANALLVG